jgi:16S rRNA processing protein RimM
VTDVIHGAGQDLLALQTSDGREVLVPFVSALVPVVDVRGGRLEVADRPGLLTPLPDDAG